MLRSDPPEPTAKSVLVDALKLPADDQAVLAGRLLRKIESRGARNAEAAFQATLLRRWLDTETGVDRGFSGAALIRKLRALTTPGR
ncbi:MAG: hypothetical protein FD180_2313 [Planctomycetota bacterium]|nr:MAG: hypothetical protein FD180_2313 [Planctomycetota bacterium]